tara:strand:+ start:93 stop:356 length:264 start_codon:yes stop_codon:yes gene_type:complete
VELQGGKKTKKIMIVSKADIKELSGFVKAKKQIEWLSQNNISYLIGGDSYPKVLVSEIERVMLHGESRGKKNSEPDFEALKNGQKTR